MKHEGNIILSRLAAAIFPDTDAQEGGRGDTNQVSPSSSGLGDRKSGQTGPGGVRNSGGVRQPRAAVPGNEFVRLNSSQERPEPCQKVIRTYNRFLLK